MTLAAPVALWMLLALPVLLILEWQRRRPREILVSSVALWRSVGSGAAASRRERRRWTAGTLCRGLAILAAVFAAAGPRGREPSPAPRVTFVVDVSAAMNRRVSTGESCLELVRLAALRAAAALPAETRITLRVVPSRTEEAVTLRVRELEAALDALQPTDLPLAWPGTLDRILVEASGERVDVFTVAAGSDRPGPRWVIVGEPPRNVGVARLAVEDDEDATAVFAQLVAVGLGTVSVEVQVLADGIECDRRRLDLESEARVRLEAPHSADRIEVRVEPGGDLAADDRAWSVRSREAVRVRVAEGVPGAFVRALEATGAAAVELGPRPRADEDVGWIGFEARDGLGPQVLLTRGPAEASWTSVPGGRLALVDTGLFAGVRSTRIRANAVRPWTGEGDVLATLSGAAERVPAIVREPGAVRILFELVESTWAEDPSFPIFFANWCAELRGASGSDESRVWRTGETWPLSWSECLEAPGGDVERARTGPDHIGRYRFATGEEVWVSLLDRSASTRGSAPETPVQAALTRERATPPRTWTRELVGLAMLLAALPGLAGMLRRLRDAGRGGKNARLAASNRGRSPGSRPDSV